ncbi:hypothetical protein [Alteriqipengyuania lutimaris]|nr:hypothetical protein [Alteriqipengyuania lutimaris]MBB3033063.1 hypothetical protein [Alteriqipengyuania lutimaris]
MVLSRGATSISRTLSVAIPTTDLTSAGERAFIIVSSPLKNCIGIRLPVPA